MRKTYLQIKISSKYQLIWRNKFRKFNNQYHMHI